MANKKDKKDIRFEDLFNGLDPEQLKMEVPSETYAAHEVGDTLPVMLYDGAFDKPYFIIE